MPVAMQAKLLRVLEEGEVERVGGDKSVKVNVRVVVATHRKLEELVAQTPFAAICFIAFTFFPYSCRRSVNARRFRRTGYALFTPGRGAEWLEGKEFSAESISALRRYSWPGNVRELRNVVERLVLLSEGEQVSAGDVQLVLPASDSSPHDHSSSPLAAATGTLAARTESFEKEVLLAEIRRHNFHMTNVARALGLERSHLYKKCQQLGIDLQSLRRLE